MPGLDNINASTNTNAGTNPAAGAKNISANPATVNKNAGAAKNAGTNPAAGAKNVNPGTAVNAAAVGANANSAPTPASSGGGRRWLGVFSLLLGIGLFSTIEIDAKVIARQADIPPAVMVFLRFAATGLVLAGLGLPAYRRAHGGFRTRDWRVFFLNGIVGVALSIGLFHLAILMFANASSAAVVFSANAVFTIVFARYLNDEPWNPRKWLALACGLAGILCFVFESGAPGWEALGAIGVMALAAMCFAFGVCLTKREVGRYGPVLFMGMSSLCGSLCTLPFAIPQIHADFLVQIRNCWPALAYMIAAGTTLAYLFYYIGLRHVSAFAASMAFFLKPVLACGLAILLLHEKMNPWTIAGTLVIMLALLLTLARKK